MKFWGGRDAIFHGFRVNTEHPKTYYPTLMNGKVLWFIVQKTPNHRARTYQIQRMTGKKCHQFQCHAFRSPVSFVSHPEKKRRPFRIPNPTKPTALQIWCRSKCGTELNDTHSILNTSTHKLLTPIKHFKIVRAHLRSSLSFFGVSVFVCDMAFGKLRPLKSIKHNNLI